MIYKFPPFLCHGVSKKSQKFLFVTNAGKECFSKPLRNSFGCHCPFACLSLVSEFLWRMGIWVVRHVCAALFSPSFARAAQVCISLKLSLLHVSYSLHRRSGDLGCFQLYFCVDIVTTALCKWSRIRCWIFIVLTAAL